MPGSAGGGQKRPPVGRAGKHPRPQPCVSVAGVPPPRECGGREAPPEEEVLRTTAGRPLPRESLLARAERGMFSHALHILGTGRGGPVGQPSSTCLLFGFSQKKAGFPAFLFLTVRASLTYRFLTILPDSPADHTTMLLRPLIHPTRVYRGRRHSEVVMAGRGLGDRAPTAPPPRGDGSGASPGAQGLHPAPIWCSAQHPTQALGKPLCKSYAPSFQK